MVLGITFIIGMSILMAILALFYPKKNPLEKLDIYDTDYSENTSEIMVKKGPIRQLSKLIPRGSDERGYRQKQNQLKQASIAFNVEEFFMIRVMLDIGVSLLVLTLTHQLYTLIVGIVLAEILLKLVLNSRRKQKTKAFDSQINEGIILMSNSLKAGYSFLQALSVASNETTGPLSDEFKQMLKEMSLGMPIEEALQGMTQRTVSEDLKLLVNAILIQKDIGGNLSEILENISVTIMERQKIKNEVKTLTAQGKLSGMIIMVMPAFLGGIIYLFNPEYISVLFTSQIGKVMLIGAVVSQLTGWVFIRKIINIEY